MFGKKKDDTAPVSTGQLTFIGVGTSISGDVDTSHNVRIDGKLKGNLRTRAKLVLGPKGVIEGDVWCHDADISGKVTGNLYVKKLLHLTQHATVEGKIFTTRLKIAEGAVYNGSCEMGEKAVMAQFKEPSDEASGKTAQKVVA